MLRSWLSGALLAGITSTVAPAQNPATDFSVDILVQNGLTLPTDLCFLPGGRVLITNVMGEISLYANGTLSSAGTIPNVQFGSERGLLSVEADPDFSNNGYIYVYYSHTSGFLHCERLTCTGDLADPNSSNVSFSSASRHVVLSSLPDVWGEHNGGSVRFGPDGMLYLAVGDDLFPCDAQSLTSKRGCLLRMDVSGLPAGGSLTEPSYDLLDPGNNPLSANTDFSQLVIANGLRNPFRMEIDPATGDIYIGDVGEGAREEISRYEYSSTALPLRNFGWPWREGDLTNPNGCSGGPPAGLIDPIASVPHTVGGASIIAGSFYRNLGGNYDFGAAYEGNIFYVDYFTGNVRRLVDTGPGGWAQPAAAPGQPTASDWASGLQRTVCMRQGPDGALWFAERPFSYPTSLLGRIRHTGVPSNTISVVSGVNQATAAGTWFVDPLVVEVRDSSGSPVANADVGFSALGPAELMVPNPVQTDANGQASVFVRALDLGGSGTVVASTPGDPSTVTFPVYSRRLTATATPNTLNLFIDNTTQAVPPEVKYIVMMSFPGSPVLPTIVGPLCIDPTYAFAIVLEDGTGAFNFVSFSGTGGVGTPTLSNSYLVPPGLLTGQLMSFQAVGFDPVSGWFRTNCEQLQF